MSMPPNTDEMIAQTVNYMQQGRLGDAESILIQALTKGSESILGYEVLAELRKKQGKAVQAIAALQQIIRLDSKHAAAYNNLGLMYLQLGHFDNAIANYRIAQELQTTNPLHIEGLTIAYLKAQKFERARNEAQRMVFQHPETGQSHVLQGHILKALGRSAEASAAYGTACDLDPSNSEALYCLVQSRRASIEERIVQHIAELVNRNDNSSLDTAYLNFALASINDNRHEFDAAFEHYRRANFAAGQVLSELGINYDHARAKTVAQDSASIFASDSCTTGLPKLPVDIRPMFIVGMPRSGTTLVEQILASHSEVRSGGELPLIMQCYNEFRRRLAADRCIAEGDKSEADIRELIIDLREQYIEGLLERDLDGPNVTDKMPENAEYLGFIRLMFPDAVVINCVRSPIATCWSIYTTAFIAQLPYSSSFEDLAHKYGVYLSSISHWKRTLGLPIIDVEYEKLVLEPDKHIRELVLRCGLDWEPNCLHFYDSTAPIFTASHTQARRPIYTSSINRWKNYERHLSSFSKLLDASLNGVTSSTHE